MICMPKHGSWSAVRRATAVCAVVLLANASAVAWAGNLAAVPMTMTPIYTNTAIGLGMIDAARRSMEAQSSRSGSGGSPAAPSRPAPVDTSAFDVGANPSISRQAWLRFEDTVRAHSDAKTADSVVSTFQRKPVRAAYLEAASPYGLRDRDLRDVTSAYLVTGWMIANQAPLPTKAQVQGVRQQIAAATAAHPPAGAAGDRQLAAELMMYELVSLIYARQEGMQSGNPAAMQAMSAQTADGLRKRGFDPSKLVLTDRGFGAR